MSQRITITLPDEVIPSLSEVARARGQTVEEFAADTLVKRIAQDMRPDADDARAEERFARWIGSVSLGHPTGEDNESIDDDLAREYSSAHGDLG